VEHLTVRDLRNEPAQVWKTLEREGMVVVTNRGRPQALMLDVDGSTLDETVAAVRMGRAMRAVAAMRERAAATGLSAMTIDEIDAEIAAARAERHAD
jgi:antitoxin (DNA-binding transcriptional repressor) of toxin-antitoxin stability system